MSRKITRDDIITSINNKNSSITFLNEYSFKRNGKSDILVKMICTCGREFSKTYYHIRTDKYLLCPICAKNKVRQTKKNNYNQRYKAEINKAGYTLINPKQDLYANQLVEVIQNNTGFRGFIYPNRAKRLKRMLIFSTHHNITNYIYNANVLAEQRGIGSRAIDFVYKDKYPVGLKIKCECGKIYKSSLRSFEKQQFKCPSCSQIISSYELKIKDFLEQSNINYISEFVINSCRDILPLPFDFYLKDYNILMEIDGEQHFYPVRFDGDMKTAQLKYLDRQKKDKIKTDYCNKYNIPLLRITYLDIKNGIYKNKILEFIQTVQN